MCYHLFEENALDIFFKENSLLSLIRGHTFQSEGFSSLWKGKLISMFSCSNYCGIRKNKSAVLKVNSSSHSEIMQFPPLPHISRESIHYLKTHILKGFQSKSFQNIYKRNKAKSHEFRPFSDGRMKLADSLKMNKSKSLLSISNSKHFQKLDFY
jgi:hypothetical protein